MRTLLLDIQTWDLVLDASGNIAMADNPYALAQDAASAIKTFQGEVYYDTSLGVPYFQSILGKLPQGQVMKAAFVKAALTVPDVVAAKCVLGPLVNRQITGQVQITDKAGNILVAPTGG